MSMTFRLLQNNGTSVKSEVLILAQMCIRLTNL